MALLVMALVGKEDVTEAANSAASPPRIGASALGRSMATRARTKMARTKKEQSKRNTDTAHATTASSVSVVVESVEQPASVEIEMQAQQEATELGI